MKTDTTFGSVAGRSEDSSEPSAPVAWADAQGDVHEWCPLTGGVLIIVADGAYPDWFEGAQIFQRWTKWVLL